MWYPEIGTRAIEISFKEAEMKKKVFANFSLINKNVVPQGNDEIVRSHDSKGSFTINSFCNTINKGLVVPIFLPGPPEAQSCSEGWCFLMFFGCARVAT